MEEVNVKIGKKDYTFRFKYYEGELKEYETVCYYCCLSDICTKLPDPHRPGYINYGFNDFCLRHGRNIPDEGPNLEIPDFITPTLNSGLYKYVEDMRPELIKYIINR